MSGDFMGFTSLKREITKLAAQCEGRVGLVIETEFERMEINCEDIFSAASLIKIPILIEGFRQYDKGLLDIQKYIPIETESVGGAGVLQALSEGLEMRIIDLMTLMIIVSDNIATNLLIEQLGWSEINQCMKDLGLKGTVLKRKMMDFTALENGIDNCTTANDMIMCLKAINEQKYLSMKSSKKALMIMRKQQFRDKLSRDLDLENVQVAGKTGELPGIEHDCAIIHYGDKTIYTAVLIDQLPHQENGRQTIAQIGKYISHYVMSV